MTEAQSDLPEATKHAVPQEPRAPCTCAVASMGQMGGMYTYYAVVCTTPEPLPMYSSSPFPLPIGCPDDGNCEDLLHCTGGDRNHPVPPKFRRYPGSGALIRGVHADNGLPRPANPGAPFHGPLWSYPSKNAECRVDIRGRTFRFRNFAIVATPGENDIPNETPPGGGWVTLRHAFGCEVRDDDGAELDWGEFVRAIARFAAEIRVTIDNVPYLVNVMTHHPIPAPIPD